MGQFGKKGQDPSTAPEPKHNPFERSDPPHPASGVGRLRAAFDTEASKDLGIRRPGPVHWTGRQVQASGLCGALAV